jgi:SpoVK/Ycf46/Vps4 family AAA+-type ATPase
VLIDGIDTLAPRRANASAADLSLDRVLSQLLVEIDGMLLYSLCCRV